MARNVIKAVTEKQRALNEATAKSSNVGLYLRIGLPVLLSVPPGTVVLLAKATVKIRAATTEQDVAMLISQCPPSLTMDLWESLKISLGVWLFMLVRKCEFADVLFHKLHLQV